MHVSAGSVVFRVAAVAVVVLCMLAGPAMGRVVTLNPVADLGLYGASADHNRGAGGRMDIGPSQTSLLKFNLQGVLAGDEAVTGATLQLYTARKGYTFDFDIAAYPLAVSWQEGTGTSGGVGGLGAPPWGPVNIGDAVWNYRSVTAVSADAVPLSTAGTPWGVAGARGIGSDLADQLMVSQAWVKSSANAQQLVGTPLGLITLTPAGVSVLNDWASGALANYGMSLWATGNRGLVTDYAAVTTREYAGVMPQLILTVEPVPEPATLSLLALAMGGAALRRRMSA